MNSIFNSEFIVCKEGYEIRYMEDKYEKHENDDEETVTRLKSIAHICPISDESDWRVYDFNDYPGAFREFIEICKRDDSGDVSRGIHNRIINFANKYGLLKENDQQQTESDFIWLEHSERMSFLDMLLRFIKNDEIAELEKFVFEENGLFWTTERKPYANFYDKEFILRQIPPFRGQKITNAKKATWALLAYYTTTYLSGSLSALVFPNRTYSGADMVITPTNLLSGLWYQFSNAVTRNQEFKQCVDCSTYFEVNTKKRRFERIYCSDKCRKRVSARKRREKEKSK